MPARDYNRYTGDVSTCLRVYLATFCTAYVSTFFAASVRMFNASATFARSSAERFFVNSSIQR